MENETVSVKQRPYTTLGGCEPPRERRRFSPAQAIAPKLSEAQKWCLRRGALSVCPCGDAWGTVLHLETG